MEANLTLGAAALTGLVFGAGACSVACLPYLGPVFLSAQAAAPWRALLPFSAGRLTGYTLLGTAAGWAGHTLSGALQGGRAGLFLGLATVAMGLLMLRRPRCRTPRPAAEVTVAPPRGRRPRLRLGAFAMGLGLALNPCVPLGTVALAAAASGDPWSGFTLGAAFGLGAVLLPGVLFGLALAWFGRQLRSQLRLHRHTLQRLGGLLLILFGGLTAGGLLHP